MYKVTKFGGSSLANAGQWKKVKAIIDSDEDRHIVVVSAVGKSNPKDHKVTDLLYLIYQHHKYHIEADDLFKEVEEKYLSIKRELGLKVDIESDFAEIRERLEKNQISEEELVSRGEYFSAKMMADYLGFDFVDAKELINFDYEGQVVEEETVDCIERAVSVHDYFVVPGFYGSYPNYKICLFSRGGSDVTGSYMAKGAKADLYENFSDVPGFYMADPRILKSPRHISQISYDELRELSDMGACVLHEETVLPLLEEDIPILVLSTDHPELEGTWVKKQVTSRKHLVTGISGKKGFLALTFQKKRSVGKLDILLEVLRVFHRYHVPVEHLPTSIDTFSVIVEKSIIEEKYYDIIADLKKNPGILSINEDEDLALIAVVGTNLAHRIGASGEILSVFGKEGIHVKFLEQGLEEYQILTGVSQKDFETSIQALYTRFAHEKIAEA